MPGDSGKVHSGQIAAGEYLHSRFLELDHEGDR
jgi:hypothetical protein